MRSVLEGVHDLISKKLEGLALADPTTLVETGADLDQEPRVRQIVTEVTRDCEETIRARIHSEYFEVGPLEKLLADPEISEIIVNGATSIWYERRGQLYAHNDSFLSSLTFQNFIHRFTRQAGILVSLDCPFADGHWQNFRLHLIVPPAAKETSLTLRRHPHNPWSLELLKEKNWATTEALNKLKSLIIQRKNFLIVGCTGSGKTSVLNACLGELPANERIVTIEDTSELSLPNQASNKLLTRRDVNQQLKDIDQSELLKQSLRMRPDRLVMGEIRGAEAKDLLMAFATGHSGCMGTLHADSARQALLRLEMLIQLGASQWSLQAVRTLIFLSLHAIVVVQRSAEGQRQLEGIYRLQSLEDVGFLLEKM